MRLIDAEDILVGWQRTGIKEYDEEKEAGIDLVLAIIDHLPTIEAKPIVHAHWEKGCDDEYIAIPWWTCSHCGKGALTKKETIYDQVLTDYCPYCGAQMDEKESD